MAPWSHVGGRLLCVSLSSAADCLMLNIMKCKVLRFHWVNVPYIVEAVPVPRPSPTTHVPAVTQHAQTMPIVTRPYNHIPDCDCMGGVKRTYMWQSPVEIKGYSVAYFDRITVFEVPFRWTSIKGGAHMCFEDAWTSNESMKSIWATPLTEVDTVLRRQHCDRNMQRNNLWFLQGTATYTFGGIGQNRGKWRLARNWTRSLWPELSVLGPPITTGQPQSLTWTVCQCSDHLWLLGHYQPPQSLIFTALI